MQTKSLSMRRALSAALFVLLLSVVGMTKTLAQSFSVGDLNYSVNADGVSVTVTGHVDGMDATGTLTIPETINYEGTDYAVTIIGEHAFSDCTGLTGSLVIPNSVVTIGTWAFINCSGFSGDLTIGNSVTTIGTWAFLGCSGFTGNLTISNSVTTICGYAFLGCTGFAGKLTLGNSVTTIDAFAFDESRGWEQIEVVEGNPTFDSRNNCNAIIKTSSNELIVGCKSTIIPNSITSIDGSAFNGCSGLLSITIPNSVTSIGYSAFGNCRGLEQIIVAEGNSNYDSRNNCNAIIETSSNALIAGCKNTIVPNSVTAIIGSAFIGCSGLNSITIPNTVIYIDNFAFEGCTGLAQIIVAEGNPNYDSRNNCNAIIETSSNELMFGCKNTVIPNTVTSIGYNAFYGCSGLMSITIPNSVVTIADYAFYGCSGLMSITISNSVVTIGDYAFAECTGMIGDLALPNSVTTIGSGAFYACSGFTGILTIPNSVTTIGNGAFYDCSGFAEVVFNAANCADVDASSYFYPFSGCGGSLVIGNSVQKIPANMFRESNFTGNLIISSSVTSIGNGAFSGCSGFSEVFFNATNCANASSTSLPFSSCRGSLIIGDNVNTIPSYLFRNGRFSALTIGNSVTSISRYAFYNCSSFTSISSHAETPPSVGTSAFYNVNRSIPIIVPCGKTNTYRNASGWNQFNNYYESCPGTSVIAVTISPSGGGTVTGSGLFEEGETCTLTATANPNYIFINWTENQMQVSTDPSYSFIVDGNRVLVANFVYINPDTYIISTLVDPVGGGYVSGSGGYALGSYCTLTAVPAEGYSFQGWTRNGAVVSGQSSYSFTVNGNATYVAHFSNGLPELHVTGITHSEFIAGQQATISWTVQNDGTAATLNGALWHDRVWLSVESRVAAGINNPILLGTFDNISALDVGEHYTQTQTFNIPRNIAGEYYLFVLTDAYDAYTIYWENNEVPEPYNPPPYLGCNSFHCNENCPNTADNRIYELSEKAHGSGPGGFYSDNFFYALIDIAVPVVPDLQVSSVITPDNFFSGMNVSVTATISNLGNNYTQTNNWTDALYIASEPDFNSSTKVCLATVGHYEQLSPNGSYQVDFNGVVPATMYGEAYFFVQTDCYDQVYEHVMNHNNIAMSESVNIILSPPADLEPLEIVSPSVVSTAESFTYSYKVYNNGAGSPNVNNWKDRVYLSQNTESIGENAVLLNIHQHYGGLQSGANYSVNETINLPISVTSGTYYLYVVTDANNEVFEYLYDGNNTAHSSQIIITAPDLQVAQVSLPEQITSGYPLNLSYTLANEGEGAIVNRSITDKIFVSVSGTMSDAIMIDSIRRNVNLLSGQSMTVMCNGTVPSGLTDETSHLLIVTDFDNDINESNESNNTYTYYPMAVLHQPLPDLQPVSLNLPSTIQAGEAVNVDFNIANLGDLDLLNSNCAFDIYALVDTTQILCPVLSQVLPLGPYVSIGINETLHFVRSVQVPPTVTSACTTFHLVVDKENSVMELDTTNNTFATNVTVLNSPLPDLMVSNVELPALQAGAEAQIAFTVNNVGSIDFMGPFNVKVYVLATDTILCPLVLQSIPETYGDYAIAAGESLQFTQNVLIPPMVNSTYSVLSVVVDEENEVLEADEDNNATHNNAIVMDYPFNLVTQSFDVSATVTAGETTSVSWIVKNTGTCPNGQIPFFARNDNEYVLVNNQMLPTPWKDMVLLSADAMLSEDDILLLSIDHNSVLSPNDTYQIEQNVVLPYSSVGHQYLLCVSDSTQVTFDNNRTDNILAVPVEVELGELPDLNITEISIEPVLASNNTYWVYYTIANQGERATQRDAWIDAFYIGEVQSVIGAFELARKVHHGALEVGASYTDSIEIVTPNGLVGNYFLVGYTDATNLIYEQENESDNVFTVPVSVMPPASCDLIAVQPEFPATMASGENMTVSWQLRNIGSNPAIGRVRNAVYLSTDGVWSTDDRLLGYADININIVSNGQKSCTLTKTLTSVTEGCYYVIVKVNMLNALNESSYENNICVSLLTTEVGFPLLAIGEQVDRTMAAGQYIFYKIEVGPEHEGQTLSCRLTTMEQQVANGLYMSYEMVPNLSQYDYGQYLPYTQEIEILIPALEQGDYYLLAQGNARNGTPQQISISTSIINFEILSIDADHGSNTGSITTKVTGAKFDSIMDFRLVNGGDYLPAEKVFFSNSTQTFTTFDLVDMPTGTYDMIAELPGGIITVKDDAFTIEEGLPAELVVNVVAPSSVRIGTTFSVNIEYGNIGTTDLNVSGFVVVSRKGHPIGITTETLEEGHTELIFDIGEANGNPDVLRPGYRGTKVIMVKATHLSNVSLAVYAIRRQY